MYVADNFANESIRSQQQTTDVLTKPLPWLKHKQHIGEMGLAVA